MSEDEASLMLNEFSRTLKNSSSVINSDRFTFFDEEAKDRIGKMREKTPSGMILADMLSSDSLDSLKGPVRTN